VLAVADASGAARTEAVEAFGVTVEVTADCDLFAAARGVLPPGARPTGARPENGRFSLVPAERGLVDVVCDEQSVAGGPVELAMALGILDAQMRMHIALHAPDHLFVHAGVVRIGDRAILLPGKSFSGKTTLVAALVRAGAEYWSDEYAALDTDGLVHPYPKPKSAGNAGGEAEEHAVESLAGRPGKQPIAVGVIALANYVPGATWAPRRCSPGEGAIKLLEHTIPARSRPEESLLSVRRAATAAEIFEGDRGEADPTAATLVSEFGK